MYKKLRDLDGFTGHASLYQLNDGSYVIASSADVPFSGPETLIFPSNEAGEVVDWCEIGGGRGYLDHEAALATISGSEV